MSERTPSKSAPSISAKPPVISSSWGCGQGIVAFTTTRQGGVSSAPFESFNLGDHVGDVASHVAANRQRLRTGLELPGEPLWLNQVHGSKVLMSERETRIDGVAYPSNLGASADNKDSAHQSENPQIETDRNKKIARPEADAAVTRQCHDVLAIMTADCLPVVLFHHAERVLGVVHGGWRSLADDILAKTLAAMNCDVGGVTAWLGPAIGPQNFEVGDDVWNCFVSQDWQMGRCFLAQDNQKFLADIYAIATAQLNALGVSRIKGGDFCTVNDTERFYSYRRDGQTGRMATIAWMTPVGNPS